LVFNKKYGSEIATQQSQLPAGRMPMTLARFALAYLVFFIDPAQAALPALYLDSLEKLAQRSDPATQTALATKFEHAAEGLPQDYPRAVRLYCQAAKRGHAQAQYNLAWMYANGRGVTRNDAFAAALFQMAAARGHEHAERMLTQVSGAAEPTLPPCFNAEPAPTETAARAVSRQAEQARLDAFSGQQASAADAFSGIALDSPERRKIAALVYRLAPGYSVDPKLALAVIAVESSFNVTARSPKDAKGLMQLIPETAYRFGVKNVYDPTENIKGGLAYLRWLLAFYRGNVMLVAAAYNAGEQTVEKYRGVPPYPETQDYVKKIARIYRKLHHPYRSDLITPSPVAYELKRN
jgi:soluble lytic murein transglycosylase-like protein